MNYGYKDDYTVYIDDHIKNVKKAYKWLLDHHIDDKVDFGDLDLIESNIKKHDKSKWDDSEFEDYAKYFYINKQENRAGFEYAWNHHQKANPHHWQYWVLISDNEAKPFTPLEMPKEFVVEMVCDWWSFSFKTGNLDEIFDWYKENKKGQLLHKNTRKMVQDLLKAIKEELNKQEQD